MPVLPSGSDVKRISINGRSTRYIDVGEGPPLLLLHGIIRSLEDWGQVIEPLSKHYRVLAPDLAGFGFSDDIPEYTLDSLAEYLWGFLDAAGVQEPVRLVGNSLGGAVIMQAAVAQPERVDRVALVNSAGFGKTVTIAIRALDIPVIGPKLLMPSMVMAKNVERSLYRDQRIVTSERIQLGFDMLSQPNAVRALEETARFLGSFRGVHEAWRRTLLDQFKALGKPTLVIWGTHDKILPATHMENAKRELPQAQHHLFQRVGHMPQTEVPEAFLAVVEPFLASSHHD